MRYTQEFCQAVWEEKYSHLSKETRLENNQKWLRYWDYLAQKNEDSIGSASEFPAQIISYLKQEQIIAQESTILDIGSGSGSFVLPLARNCAQVMALDMSTESIRLLEKQALAENLPIATVNTMWENFSADMRFDIVFSSMCPAISDPASLAKMESYSNKNCVLLTVGQGSSSLIRKTIRTRLTQEPLTGLSPDVIYIFNYLYAQGNNPNLKFYPRTSRPKMTLEEAYEMYLVYFSIFGYIDKPAKNTIYQTLEEFTKDGFCTDCVTINSALMYWDIQNGYSKRNDELCAQ